MKLPNRLYDFLKWFALVAIPALNVYILKIGDIWSLEESAQIAATISATGILIAALIGASSYLYWNDVDEEDEDGSADESD